MESKEVRLWEKWAEQDVPWGAVSREPRIWTLRGKSISRASNISEQCQLSDDRPWGSTYEAVDLGIFSRYKLRRTSNWSSSREAWWHHPFSRGAQAKELLESLGRRIWSRAPTAYLLVKRICLITSVHLSLCLSWSVTRSSHWKMLSTCHDAIKLTWQFDHGLV